MLSAMFGKNMFFSNGAANLPVTAKSSSEGSLDEVLNVIEASNREVVEVRESEVILVIGMTGAGKSTLINYLAGRKMLPTGGLLEDEVICENPLLPIGAGLHSCTSKPQICKCDDTNIAFCDCPGFEDTGGVTAEIANAFSIQNVARNCPRVKGIIFMVEYGSLRAIRAQGLDLLIERTLTFLGPEMNRYLPSVFLLVSKTPQDMVPKLNHFFEEYVNERLSKNQTSLIKQLLVSGNIGTYSPFDNLPEQSLVFDRMSMLKKLQSFAGIEKDSNSFNIALSEGAKLRVLRMANEVTSRITSCFEKNDFAKLGALFKLNQTLSILNVGELSQERDKLDRIACGFIRNYENKGEAGINVLKTLLKELPEDYHDVIKETKSNLEKRLAKEKADKQALENVQKESQKANASLHSLQSEHKTLKKDFAEAKISKEEYQKRNAVLEQEMSQVKQQFSSSQQQMANLQNRLNSAEQDARNKDAMWSSRLNEVQKSVKDREDRISSLERRLSERDDRHPFPCPMPFPFPGPFFVLRRGPLGPF